MWRLRSVGGPLGNCPAIVGIESRRNSARGPRLSFWDAPPRLVGAAARQNNLPIWRLNASILGFRTTLPIPPARIDNPNAKWENFRQHAWKCVYSREKRVGYSSDDELYASSWSRRLCGRLHASNTRPRNQPHGS